MLALNATAAQTQYDSGDPTPAEQYVLEVINRARANPTAEGTRLGIDINEGLPSGQTATPHPPLAMNKILLGTSRAHSADMYNRKFFGHVNPDDKDPFQRMTAAGYNFNSAGENIATGSNFSAAALEDNLMIDKGEPGRGHRVNLLNTDPTIQFLEIGVGSFAGATLESVTITGTNQTIQVNDFLTQDFGMTSVGPFVVGVVYADANSNNFYDIGEGISGVTVTPDSGSYFAVTGTAGGYAIPVGSSGTLTLTFSGGPLSAPVQKQVQLDGNNKKVDLLTTAPPPTPPAITSSLSDNATVNAAYTYTITASGSQPITFGATGLPAGLTLSGATISGKPEQSGQFMITLTASNSSGKDTQTLTLTVAGFTSLSTVDSDGDGFPDELETALGTNPHDAKSTPFSGAPASPQALPNPKLTVRLNFLKTNVDTLSLTGMLPVPANFAVAGKTVTVDVGGVIRTFTLDAKGMAKSTSGTDTFKLKVIAVKGAVAAQNSAYTVKITKSSLSALLADEGMVNATVTNSNITVPVIVLFNAQYLTVNRLTIYSAKAGKTGAAN
ncbi:MAG TPA: CAP domain-containing protein [Planctomycetota bacterium]|nr:CAP domain-containing protein [Planctomycetota bacterium]